MKNVQEEVDIRIIKARANVRIRQPFLGAVAMTMRATPRPGILTMATDGRDMFYDPEFLDKVTEAELTGVVAEEAYHKAKKHHLRRGFRIPDLWNIACDYQVHNDLLKDGFVFPKFVEIDGKKTPTFHDPQYAELSAEDIYHLLKKKEEEQDGKKTDEQDGNREERNPTSGMGSEGESPEANSQKDGDEGDKEQHSEECAEGDGGDDGNGIGDDDSGSGNSDSSFAQAEAETQRIAEIVKAVKSGVGIILDAPDADSEIETEIALNECLSVAKRAGNMPGYLQKLVKELLTPETDWRTELRRFISPSYRKDSTWARPNRRFLHSGMILPGYVADGVSHLVIAVDGSGSIDYPALQRVLSEVQGSMEEGGIDKVSVVYCDTHVYNEREYVAGDQLEILPAQCGGTKFKPVFDWMKENASEAVGVVYFTDMMAGDWGAVNEMEDAPPTLWAAHGDPRYYREQQPAFGDVIEINY